MRYFIDQNLHAVGAALAAVRDDVCHPGHRELPEVPLGTPDEEWMRVVGAGGLDLVVITRDRRIRTKPAERAAFRAEGIRAFFLTGKREATAWEKLGTLVRQWNAIERLVERNGAGPWAVAVPGRGRLTDISLGR